MPFKTFNDIKYPIPGMDTAMEVLRPGCKWSVQNNNFDGWLDETGENREPPTWEEIQAEVKREYEIYTYYEYERQREKEYLKITDQLDMLFHDIENGNLENGSWIKHIREVKNKFPKP